MNIEEKDELVDYPYLGIGEKPYFGKKHKTPTEEQLERIVGG